MTDRLAGAADGRPTEPATDDARRAPLPSALLATAATLWPGSVDPDDDLVRSLEYLDVDVAAEPLVRTCYVLGTALVLAALLASLLLSPPWSLAAAIPAAVLALVVLLAGPKLPELVATARRTRALGAAPTLVTRAVLSTRLAASPERAARFASAADGPLARSLAGHVRRTAGSPRAALDSFGAEWRPWFPALDRALSLVESASRESPERRAETLDRAGRVVREAARDRTSSFAASIRGPTTALYAFGVLVPLALASLLPALRATGVPASLPVVVAVYDLLLPAGLLVASAWLVARRPVAFPPPAIGREHPSVPDARWPAAVAGLVAGAAAWVIAGAVAPPWTPPIASAGVAVGLALVVRYRPARAVRASVRDLEDGLPDAMSLLGGRVRRGEPVETALPAVADELSGSTADAFAEAARRQRRLGVDVETAFLGRSGPLATRPSPRARSCVSLLALAASRGRPAGEAVTAMGDHLAELERVEREARRAVEQVAATLANTAAVFAPLVGGATVALADAMGRVDELASATGADPASSVGVAGLGVAVGIYVLLLAAILTALSTGLSRGFDRSLVGYRVGIALLAATPTYLTAVVGTGLLV